MSKLSDLKRDLAQLADPVRARNLAWFFKTGKGEYGAGDRFLGITVPQQRRIALRYRDLPLSDVEKLLASPIHEHRFTALEILVAQYRCEPRNEIAAFYLKHRNRVNNWDLVDTSAPYILGQHLLNRSRRVLYRLVRSKNLWDRRIAIISTLMFIRAGQLDDTFAIAAMLLKDEHDLIRKATGWMLREAGKRSPRELIAFLKRNYAEISRTTLRYAIERFPPARRKRILAGDLR